MCEGYARANITLNKLIPLLKYQPLGHRKNKHKQVDARHGSTCLQHYHYKRIWSWPWRSSNNESSVKLETASFQINTILNPHSKSRYHLQSIVSIWSLYSNTLIYGCIQYFSLECLDDLNIFSVCSSCIKTVYKAMQVQHI